MHGSSRIATPSSRASVRHSPEEHDDPGNRFSLSAEEKVVATGHTIDRGARISWSGARRFF